MSDAKVALGRGAVLRPAAVDHGQTFLRELPCAGARVHRWPAAFARRHRGHSGRSTRRHCSTSPTTLRSDGATRVCARSSSRCEGRCSTSIRWNSDSPAGSRRSSASCPAMKSSREAFQRRFRASTRRSPMENMIRAIAAYERTLFSGNSAFDRYVFAGDHRAFSDRQKAGMALFFGARRLCAVPRRHQLQRRMDGSRAPVASPSFADTGTGLAVRVPTLRNLATHLALHSRWPFRRPRCGARSLRKPGRRSGGGCEAAPRSTNYRRARRSCGIPPFPDRRSLSPATAKRNRRMLALRSMNLDATYGRHVLLPHPVSERGAAQDLVQELSVAVARTSADSLKLTYRLSADLAALQVARATARRAYRRLVAPQLLRSFHRSPAPAITGNTIFRPRAPGRPITSRLIAKGMAPLLKGAAPGITSHVGSEAVELVGDARPVLADEVHGRSGTTSRSCRRHRRQSAGAVILGAETSVGETRFPPR